MPKHEEALTFVIDGSNIAHLDRRLGPSLNTLDLAIAALKRKYAGANIISVVDASFRHALAKRDGQAVSLFESRLETGEIFQLPAGIYGDSSLLTYAREKPAVVVSGDRFSDNTALRVGVPLLPIGYVDGIFLLDSIILYESASSRSICCSVDSVRERFTKKARQTNKAKLAEEHEQARRTHKEAQYLLEHQRREQEDARTLEKLRHREHEQQVQEEKRLLAEEAELRKCNDVHDRAEQQRAGLTDELLQAQEKIGDLEGDLTQLRDALWTDFATMLVPFLLLISFFAAEYLSDRAFSSTIGTPLFLAILGALLVWAHYSVRNVDRREVVENEIRALKNEIRGIKKRLSKHDRSEELRRRWN